MKNKFSFKVFGLLLAVVVVLFGGIGITGVAAQTAIPGDALYPVKTTIESTRLSLAQDAGDRAQMKLAFAEQRLTEIGGLIREGRFREIREAVLAFEANINAAVIELGAVSASDPARAALITQEVTSALTRYAQMLSELAAVAPESVKPQVVRALDTTHIASGLGQSAGSENANDNTNANDNVNLNGNDNGGVDDNSNDDNSNTNVNANDNGDDNTNSSDDSNTNDDNSNANDDDSNANVNANDNGSVDDNSNDNSADDNANDNGSTDDGGNDNSSVDDNSNDNGSVDDNGGDDNSNDNGADDNSGGSSGSDDNSNDDSSGSGGGSDDNGNDDNSGKGSGKDD